MKPALVICLCLAGCFEPWPEVAGVPYYPSREVSTEELYAIERVIQVSPELPWSTIVIRLVEELPGEGPKPGGWTYPSRPPVSVSLDPRDSACVLAHEMVEHVKPGLKEHDWNGDHSRWELTGQSIALQSLSDCKDRF